MNPEMSEQQERIEDLLFLIAREAAEIRFHTRLRDTLVLGAYGVGCSHREIADALGESVDTVRMRSQRGWPARELEAS